MAFSAFQLTQIFEKIQFIGANYQIVKSDSYYRIEVTVSYTEYNDPIIEEFYIYEKDEDTDWAIVDYINEVLDRQIEKEKERERKYQERKKLIASLTPEQRELLGV